MKINFTVNISDTEGNTIYIEDNTTGKGISLYTTGKISKDKIINALDHFLDEYFD